MKGKKKNKQTRGERLRLYREVKEILDDDMKKDPNMVRFFANNWPPPTKEEMGF